MSTGVLTMPSLLRLLTVLAILFGVVYGGLYSLAHFVQPSPRQMSVFISPSKFYQNR
jgi:phage shock protein PspC (stress-responsive transcriptional regulator)